MSDELFKASNGRGRSCELCMYWDEFEADKAKSPMGLCRRYAPRAALNDRKSGVDYDWAMSLWPQTHRKEWCGEFKTVKVAEISSEKLAEVLNYVRQPPAKPK